MTKKDRNSRKYSEKAIIIIEKIFDKHPSGISDVTAINEESRALVEKRIQQLRECLKKVFFKTLLVGIAPSNTE